MALSTGCVRSPPSWPWLMFLAKEDLAGVPHWYSFVDSCYFIYNYYVILLDVMTLTGPFTVSIADDVLFSYSMLPPLIYLLLSMLSLTMDSDGC